MIISLEKKKFIDAISTASRFAQHNTAALPALSSILIIAGDDGIKFRATNLETGVDLKVSGEKKGDGVVAIPAHILKNIASTLTGEGTVSLEHTGDIVVVKSGSAKSSIKTTPYDDFPSIPFPENPKNRFILPGGQLRTLITSVASCASTSTVRPELSSIYLFIEGGILTLVATDSFRLVEKKTPLKTKTSQSKILIPAKNALDIAQALPDEDVIVSFDEHQCAFIWDGGTLVSRLTSAVYPDYHQIIPKESVVVATVHRRDFETALKRVAVFSDSFQKIRLNFDPKTKTLELFSRNTEVGESTERISAKIEGNPLELSFNHRYLSAILPLTSTEHLTLSASGIGRPLIAKGVGDTSLLYLVSPMNQ